LGGEARIVPDLAYGVPLPELPTPVATSRRRKVGVSPIAYRDPRSWPGGDAGFFQGYCEMLVTFIRELLADRCEVSLFATDWCDWAVVEDVRSALSAAEREAVTVADTRTVPDLLKHVDNLDLVVASRLHGLLLAQRAGRPTIALSYDRKVDTLMSEMGFSHFCVSLDHGSLDQLRSAYRAITPELTLVQLQVQRRVQEYADRVDAQFEEIFGADGLVARR
jgi:polysaccharide pyruvyl transferase WcaK-like protein